MMEFKVETLIQNVQEAAFPVYMRACHELPVLKENAKALDGEIDDYVCEVHDMGECYRGHGDRMSSCLVTQFIIQPLRKGGIGLREILRRWETMATPPNLMGC